MKPFSLILCALALVAGSTVPSHAGDKDWARAGKALTVIEGLRVVTGGDLDVIGKVTGIDRGRRPRHERIARHYACREDRVWVPEYRWEKRYVHEHESYDPEYGEILVEGHYIRYQVEDGGYWKVNEVCR